MTTYNNIHYVQVRACDVFPVSDTRLYYFVLDESGRPTGDHFRTLSELRRYIDSLPKHCDKVEA